MSMLMGRGEFGTAKLNGEEIYGFYLFDLDIQDMTYLISKSALNFLWNLSPEKLKIFKRLFFHTGLAESCYDVGEKVFSIAKQINGSGIGFIQIEQETAISVLEETIKAINSNTIYRQLNDRIDLSSVLEYINRNPVGTLNNIEISLLIFRLKLGNRNFEGIPGFNGDKNLNPSLEDLGKSWKEIWNTNLGKGTVEEFVKRNNKYCKIIGIEKIF